MQLTINEKIVLIIKRRGLSISSLAEKLGQSRQNLTNKLSRNNFTIKELELIANALDCDFITSFVFRDTNESI